MVNEIILLCMFIGLLIGLLSGHPLAFVLGGVGTIAGVIGWGDASFNVFVTRIYDIMNNYSLVAIPLFVLMANFLTWSNVAEGLFDAIRYLFGPVRGGLAVAVIAVSTVFAATTGIVGASVVTMGMLGLPVLLKHGYQKELSLGAVCAGGTLGILIPPSIMLVIMGSYTQLSVGQLFLAAIVPGLLLSLFYIIYVFFICWKNPEYGPALSPEEAAEMPVKDRIKNSLVHLIPPLILILGVLGSIFLGIATPTEAAGMGALIAIFLTMFYKKFNLEMLKQSVEDTAKTTAMCFVILIGANAFTSIFMGLNGDEIVMNLVSTLGLGQWGAFILMMLITFVLGMFIDWIGIVMIVFPIFLPILDMYGFDRLWVVTSVAVLLQTCFLTPPFGYALFYIKGIVSEDITITHIYRGVIPFIIIILLIVALTVLFPEIIMYLPNRASIS
ncbi:MAG: TRAP transporter large permease subunit [Clostridia bacterium]|nr:TRAP transporter large permease subunit [Clostridia bacterium]